ncbi:efflux RND transporter periplasmic adaptor subunit [Phaeobacter inhibens]|uniref:efflux RND transporter periplasmic adaptor subunit n=1 Tax=Phaeobacter inhibens TaxID=221822 RepID=UPI00295EFB54|nr:efflux RND transporter periplasmic adaptor subunit [Phaeobacter inhibens]
MKIISSSVLVLFAILLSACLPEDESEAKGANSVTRGLVTTVVSSEASKITRVYPGVLEPSEITSLSFEVGGKLGRLDLSIGQRIAKGDLIAQLDDAKFLTTIENRQAAVEEAEATLKQAEEDLERSEQLLERGAVTRVSRDEDRTAVLTGRARLKQAEENLVTAQEELEDTRLLAPFDGIVNSVDTDSFDTVSAGTVIASAYEGTSYEVAFSVNFSTVNQLSLGAAAKVTLSDDPDTVLDAKVTEIGERADTVSSFPVSVTLADSQGRIRAGMAVEVSFQFDVLGGNGFLIPISAAITDQEIPETAGPNSPSPVSFFVFDPEDSIVRRRDATMAGLEDNKFVVIDGLNEGDHVAVAGVSFLHDGMNVKLLDPKE